MTQGYFILSRNSKGPGNKVKQNSYFIFHYNQFNSREDITAPYFWDKGTSLSYTSICNGKLSEALMRKVIDQVYSELEA